MPLSGYCPVRCAALVLLGIALSMLMPQAANAARFSDTEAKPQAVLLLHGQTLLAQRMPAFIQIQPGRFLSTRRMMRACARLPLNNESLFLYLPDSQHCELIRPQDQLLLRRRLHKLTGHWLMDHPQARLHERPFLAIAPAHDSSDQARTSCSCSNNNPPEGVVMCDAQTRTAGTPIGPIEFLASDADGDALSPDFSYQRDADPVLQGLPSPLTSSCTPGSGTLQCIVNGFAPAPAGIWQINLMVSDGSAAVPLNSLLEVLAPVQGRIFADGFESLGCM